MQAIVRNPNIVESLLGARAVLHAGFDRIYASLPQGSGWATCAFGNFTLASHFQPIFSVAEQRCVAYEGLLSARTGGGQSTSPETVFALSAGHQEELFLDWLCRALHLRNFRNIGTAGDMVFLNAYPEAAIEDPHHPQVFGGMIAHYGLDPAKVVVEILETGVSDEAKLIDAANLYRKLGCKIAIDDFGIGYSNFDRLWRLKPDFVKIDRSVTASAVRDGHARLVLSNMVKLIHECGACVVIEGIETRDEALLAISVGTDFVQGYYFARPGMAAIPQGLCEGMFAGLVAERPLANIRARIGTPGAAEGSLDLHAHALNIAILDLQRGAGFAHATESFRALPNVLRVYLANPHADQRGDHDASRMVLELIENVATGTSTADAADRSPLKQLQQVLTHSLAAPRQLHVIAPIEQPAATAASTAAKESTGAFTLSCAFDCRGEMVVLAADLLDRRRTPARIESPDAPAMSVTAIALAL